MRLINRLLAILGIILLMLTVTAFLAAPQLILDIATRLNDASLPMRVLQLLVALLIDALLISLIYRLLRPQRSEGLMVRVRGARTEVSIDSVQRQINARVNEVPDVIAAQAEVAAENGNARISLRVRARADIVVPEKQKEITRVLKQLVEKQLGLRLAGPPIVHINLVEEEEGEAPAAAEPTAAIELPPAPRPVPEAKPSPPPRPEPEPAAPAAAPSQESEEEEAAGAEEADQRHLEGPTMPLREEASEEQEEPWRAFLLGDDEDEDTVTPG